jgi:AAA+ superfamily predicted ATPase
VATIEKRDRPTLLLIPDGHKLWTSSPFVRLLAEKLEDIERGNHVVGLLAPVDVPCPELARERVVLYLPLPGPEVLKSLCAAALRGTPMGNDPRLVEAAAQALAGLGLGQARRALRRARLAAGDANATIALLQAEKRDLVAAEGVLEVIDGVPTLAEVGGLEALKAWLLRRKRALEPAAQAFGLPKPRGVLVIGVQGCGKSLVAKATASALGVPLARLDLGRLYASGGAPDEPLRRALQIAEAMSPAVLWLDEIDKAFATAATSPSEAGGRLLGTMLTWLGEQRGVFVAATANRVDHLPAELLRKGRFDETFFVDTPDAQVRREILTICLARSGRRPLDFDLDKLALTADRLTGAEVEQGVVEALAQAWSDNRQVTNDDIASALSKTVPFVETYEPQVKALREWARKRCRPAGTDRSLRDLFDT